MNKKTTKGIFTSIYETESDMIFRYCVLRVSDREQALDIVQETFLRLWKTLEQGQTIDKVKPFLFTIAHHLIIDWYRKKKSVSLDDMMNGGVNGDDKYSDYEPVEESAAKDLELANEGRFLVDAIEKLSPSNRQAVYLRYVEGLSPPDIAEIIGISTNAASVRVNRGLEELRKITGYENVGNDSNDESDRNK